MLVRIGSTVGMLNPSEVTGACGVVLSAGAAGAGVSEDVGVGSAGAGVAGVVLSVGGVGGVDAAEPVVPITRSYVSRNLGSRFDSDAGSIIYLY